MGEIITLHGKIRTPAFVPVGTGATIKSLTPEEVGNCGIDVFFVNTYHMLFRPGPAVIEKFGGLHKFTGWDKPLMTDSGGFQIFSLGERNERKNPPKEEQLIRVTDRGAYFKSFWDGKTVFLEPRDSIKTQQVLGADIMMAFDECTFYPIKKKYAKKAMERTHRWAKICLEQKRKGKKSQALYGIVQGSVFKDLRVASAKFISLLPFDGLAIGSVANSQEPRSKVFSVLDWTMPILYPTTKPIHFLGIGEVEDIFLSVERGVDSFDCVAPTRLGRMGWIFSKREGLAKKFRYDITKSQFTTDKKSPEIGCQCPTCQNFSRGYLNHLFRNRELLAYRLASLHNLYFFGSLMGKIRDSIKKGKFLKTKKEWLE